MEPSVNHQQTVMPHLRRMTAARAPQEGRNDSLYPGLRYYRFSAPIAYNKTQHLMPGIVLVLQGSKTAKLGNQTLSYDDMNYLVIGSETVCQGTVVTASADRPYLAIHLDLPPALLVKTFIALSDTPDLERHPPMQENAVLPIDSGVLDAFIRLLPVTDNALDRNTMAPLVVEEIIVRLLRSPAATAIRSAAAVTRSATRIQKSMQFIQTSFAAPLTVAELASQLAMSESHYAHSFRQVAGVSPMRYLREVRLDQARALLIGRSLRPSEVAAHVGFESNAHFAREFKRRFDVSPTQFMRGMAGHDPL